MFGNTGDIGNLFDPRPFPRFYPISHKVTQSTQESAEGRNRKMTKRNGGYRCVLFEVCG